MVLEEEALSQLFPSLGRGGEPQKHSLICRSLCSVISGVGELDMEKDSPKKEDPQAQERPYPDCPFLLLDVRDRDAYEQCHIVGGEQPQGHRARIAALGHSPAGLCPPAGTALSVPSAYPAHPSFLGGTREGMRGLS